ncbi:MAG: hypothetical protein AB1503_02495 [Bacillota bacterium]|nr:hypothetical protein [Bacillota bacterium]
MAPLVWWGVAASAVLVGGLIAALRSARWLRRALITGVLFGLLGAAFTAGGEFGWHASRAALLFADLAARRPYSAVDRFMRSSEFHPIGLLLFPGAVGSDVVNWGLGLLIWPLYAFPPDRAPWPGAAVGMFLATRPVLAWATWFLQGALGGIALVVPLVWFVRLIGPEGELPGRATP